MQATETAAAATQLFNDMNDPDHLFRPYFNILPKRGKVWSYHDIPESYLPLIQNEVLVRAAQARAGGGLS